METLHETKDTQRDEKGQYILFEQASEGVDFVIQTNDGTMLFVHKVILQRVSPIFATLFSLPQPAEAGVRSNQLQTSPIDLEKQDLPTVNVTERKGVWDIILRILYHNNIPDISLQEIRAVLEGARKYELESVTNHLRHILLCPLRTQLREAHEVYAIASLYGLSDVAQQAARDTLAVPLYELCTKELYDIPAYTIQRLLEYRWRCQEAARAVAAFTRTKNGTGSYIGKLHKKIEWLPRTNFTFLQCNCGTGGVSCSIKMGSEYELFSGRPYWREYMERAEQALKERPVGSTVKDPMMIIPALRAADNCMNCRQHVYLDMTAFAEFMEAAVDHAISSVRAPVAGIALSIFT